MGNIFSRDRRASLNAALIVLGAFLLFGFISTGDLSGQSLTCQPATATSAATPCNFFQSLNLGEFGTIVFSGLLQGMLLFLVAAGLSIIFGLMDVLNFAQGSFFMLGAYVAWEVSHNEAVVGALPDPNVRFVLGLLLAMLIGGALGAVLERGLLRPLYVRPTFQLVATFGVSLIGLELIKAIWGTSPRTWISPFALSTDIFELFGGTFRVYRVVVIVVGFLLIAGIGLLLSRTRIGIIIRAGVEDREMVEALGINVRLVFTLVFALGCTVAALGGVFAAPFLGASNGMGSEFLLGAIAVVVLGG
ncbi:MAG: branched-chain amino acid ABC transporter permease, partial [Anaerolineae bacterium]|nr:branched-chain amino acid ABC transporter permease [Anaerolineae bacterium]